MDKNYCGKSIFKDSTTPVTDITTLQPGYESCLAGDIGMEQKKGSLSVELVRRTFIQSYRSGQRFIFDFRSRSDCRRAQETFK